MAEIDAKVNMSLDDIIKMEKKKKASNPKANRGGTTRGGTRGAMRGNTRGSMRGSMKGSNQGNNRGNNRGNYRGNNRGNIRGNIRGNTRGNMRGNMRNNMRGRSQSFNRRGQYNRYPQNNSYGGFYNNNGYSNGIMNTNLRRSRSNLSLNRLNQTSPRSNRGGFASRRGGRFGLTRSRSRTNLSYNNKQNFVPKNKGFLQRTSSMPNLRDPTSVYNRLGYQSPGQVAYRNRVKRAKNVLLQRHSKAMRMQRALSLSPSKSPMMSHYNSGSLRSDQVMRAQRRSQYEQKLMRMGNARSNIASSMAYMNSFNNPYNQTHPAMVLYDSEMESQSPHEPQRQMQRGRSPFRQSLQNFKAVMERARSASVSRQKRGRSRSQSRTRGPSRRNSMVRSSRNSVISLDGDIEDRSFSEVMYSLSNNFGVTGRTLNDRFSLF